MKVGDTFICIKTVNNMFGAPLYIKDNTYKVLFIDEKNNTLIMNHNLIANEYAEHDISILKYFISNTKYRMKKLKLILEE